MASLPGWPRSPFPWCVLWIPLLASAADLAPPATYENRPIAAIRFEPSRQPVAAADLTRLLPLHPGERLNAALVRETIKRLYATGNYSNIEVNAEPAASGMDVVIRTTGQWFVGPVEVHGDVKSPPNRGQLVDATRLSLGAPFDDADLQTAAQNVRDLLRRNGLYLAQSNAEIQRDPARQEVSITFQVRSGKRARLTLPEIQGDTKIPAAKLAQGAHYKGILFFPWKLATGQNVQSGLVNIQKQYDKQDRLTAAVTLTHEDYLAPQNRVRPVIHAEGGPKINIITEGAKVSKSDLKKYVPVYEEETVNRDLLVRGVGNLRDYFQSKGYFDVEVNFETRDLNPDQRRIVYTLALGERHRVVQVRITGNRYFKTADIRDRIFIEPAGFIRLRHGRYSDSFASRDEAAIKALYRDSGFRDCKVTIAASPARGRKGDVDITIAIVEGPQYLVSTLQVNGISRRDRDTIVRLLAAQPGEPYSEDSIAIDRNYLLELYQSEGYPDVTFNYTAARAAPDRMAVVYTVKEGPPRYVRDVLITGLHVTRQRLIKPDMVLKPGDPLSWTEMGAMQRRLYNLGVFDTVDMAIQNPQGDTENKYVLFHLVEGHRYSMAVGLGAEIAQVGGNQASLDYPTGTTGFAPRGEFDISRLNMWGLGHSLSLNARYSTLDRRVALSYLIPRFRNTEGRNISFTALYEDIRDVLTFTAQREEVGTQVSQRISKATTAMWRYSWRNVKVNNATLKINPELIPLESQAAQIATIGGNVVQDRRDDPANAHRGLYNSADLGLVDHYFGGNKNFLRFLGRNSYYKTIKPGWVLASNTQFGWIHPFAVTPGVSGFDYVPIPEHFFAGGADSDRGFPFNQAGPRDLLTGFPLGGDAELFHSTELRFPFLGDNISGVFFHDMGNVYSDLSSISFRVHQRNLQDFDYMVHAVGFGLRYRTPVGPLRVDLAYSINPPTFYGLNGTYNQLLFGGATTQVQSVSHFQFFISIGQAF